MTARPGPPARALLLTPVLPAGGDSGLAMRAELVRRALARIATVHVVVVDDRSTTPSADRAVASGDDVIHHPITSPRPSDAVSGWLADPPTRERLRRLAPLDPGTRAASPPAVAALAARIRDEVGAPPDIVYALRVRTALWAEPFLGSARLTILDLDDDEATTLAALGGEADRRGEPTLADQLRHEAASVARLIDEVAPRFDQVAVASPDDVGPIRRHGNAHVVEVPNAVVVPDRARAGREPVSGAAARLLLVGDLAYLPNRWAATDLVGTIAPAVRALGVEVAVDLVGPHPPEALGRGDEDRLTVHGRVDAATLAALLSRASVAVAPIAVGGGTRLKILEAWAHEVPVVATPAGAAGLGAVDGDHLALAADAEALAAAIVDCLQRPDDARRRVRRGRALVARRHDLDLVSRALADSWQAHLG